MSASYSANYGAVYYGSAPHGKRLHLADSLYYATERGVWAAKAYCGNNIETYREEQAPPSRITEFCKNCFRSLAWEIFEAHVLATAGESLVEVSA